MNVRLRGDWESWIKFFLKGVTATAEGATNSAIQILAMKDRYEKQLSEMPGNNNNSHRLLDLLFEMPRISRADVKDRLEISSPTAGALLEQFENLGILADITPERQRNKRYSLAEYVSILEEGT